ncbi:glycine zipper 2TM domain-containing protein [Zobellella maritima]|uniref:glycine zipper 2TM domain-containing protein n=1 Tax=Zobellella maritima TaxID=2059725 RepID=UPI000E30AB58|nr:glycine zipper 2TM domain-containing protein [Zobellella maritima]
MNITRKAVAGGLAATLLLAACSNLSERDRNTAIGAGVGGVAGSVLTEGSALGTLGGAVVGGVIGHEVSKDKK